MDWTKHLDIVEVNITELCNLRCDFCPHGHDYPNRNLHMRLGTASIIASSLEDMQFGGVVSIAGKGEPTIAENFAEISEIFLDGGWKTKLNTNGKDVDKYIDIVKEYDVVYYDYYEENWDEYLRIIDKYSKYPNFKFWYKPPLKWNEYTRSYTNRAGAMEGDFQFDVRNKPYQKYCGRPTRKVFIDWNGDYRLCCEDWRVGVDYSLETNLDMYNLQGIERNVSLDNIMRTSIPDYLNTNKELAKYRDKLLRGDRGMSPCDKCSFKNNDNYEHFLKVLDEYQQHDIQSTDNYEGGNRIPLRTIV